MHPFGCETVALYPREARSSVKNDDHGKPGIYLCPATPNNGHRILILKTGKIKECSTILTRHRVFPFLLELRKSVPYALSFAPTSLEELNAPALLTERAIPLTPAPSADLTQSTAVLITPSLPLVVVKHETRPKRKGKPTKAVPREFAIGDHVMTVEGPAIVHRLTGDSIPAGHINLTWPNHHLCDALTVYSCKREHVWFQTDRPTEIYDSYRQLVKEINTIDLRMRVLDDLVDPLDVIGIIPADQILLPKYERKHESPYCGMMNAAEDAEWSSLLEKGMFSEPIEIDSLTVDQQRFVLRLNWLYKAKCDSKGFLSRIKARLVADGSREQGTLPAGQVYTPVMVMTTVRALLISGIQNPLVRFDQIDVESAYATAKCLRTIHVHYPKGRYPPGGHGARRKCLRLIMSLYGVVDSGRNFYEEWVDYHIAMGFQTIHADKCFLIFWVSENEHIRICFHVDDNIIAHVGDSLWSWYLETLAFKYKFTKQPLHYCMGIEFTINYELGTVKMTQCAQIEKMLRDLKLTNLAPVRSPVADSMQPVLDAIEAIRSPETRDFPMMAYLGHLNCLQQGTRPEITRPLKIASKFARLFGAIHILWVKRIVRFLAGTKTSGITFRRVAVHLRNLLQTFTDATHASDPDTRRSISGIVIKLGGNTILWKANFQKIVSHSSTESEIMALDNGATLGQYVKWICMAMGINPILPMPIYIDNSSSIDIMTNPIQPGRNLHIHARFFYIKDIVLVDDVALIKIGTDDQIADVLVTFKNFQTFHRLRTLLLNCAYVAVEDGVLVWVSTYLD